MNIAEKRISPIVFLALVLGMMSSNISVAESAPLVAFEERSNGLEITVDGKPFASYHKPSAKIPRPFLANVYAPSGVKATRNHPPIEGTDSMDHATYHPGVWMAYAGINGNDYWRLKQRMAHDRYLGKMKSGRGEGAFTVRSAFLDTEGAVVAKETVNYTVLAREAYTLLIVRSEIASEKSDLVFGDDQEYGFGIRARKELEERSGGRILNAEGRTTAEKTYGRAAQWCDYSGKVDGELLGLMVMTDPMNFSPSWFHNRDYGLVVANPFGRKKVAGGTQSSVSVKKGEALKLGFALAVYSSDGDSEIDRETIYKDYLGNIH